MNAIAADLVTRIAKMAAVDVPHEQIAQALSIDAETVGRIVEMELCQQQIAQARQAQFDQAQTQNEAWDAVEALGANAVLQALQTNPDPEFALRAAAQANKAQRRGVHGNRPIQAGAHGGRAVLAMPVTFIENLQQVNIADTEATHGAALPKLEQQPERKAVNFMNPQSVEKLLRPAASTDHSEESHVAAMFDSAPIVREDS